MVQNNVKDTKKVINFLVIVLNLSEMVQYHLREQKTAHTSGRVDFVHSFSSPTGRKHNQEKMPINVVYKFQKRSYSNKYLYVCPY